MAANNIRRLRVLNNFISIIIIAIVLYTVATPLIPNLELFLKKHTDATDGLVYASSLATNHDHDKLKPIPNENRLVIPSIRVDGEIYEGGEDQLNNGIWRNPETSKPDDGGNSVFIAHRFLYSNGPNTFYHLDKVQVGENILVFWQGKEYIYEVFETKVVEATETEIEKNTVEPIITLYTCTPLWTVEKRLVVRGRLIS